MGTEEAIVETYLIRRVEELGGMTRKLQYVGRNGAPDRMVIFHGKIIFIECKALGRKAKAHQERELDLLRKMGFVCAVVDSKEMVDAVLRSHAP